MLRSGSSGVAAVVYVVTRRLKLLLRLRQASATACNSSAVLAWRADE
jgi:hypothetical protein